MRRHVAICRIAADCADERPSGQPACGRDWKRRRSTAHIGRWRAKMPTSARPSETALCRAEQRLPIALRFLDQQTVSLFAIDESALRQPVGTISAPNTSSSACLPNAIERPRIAWPPWYAWLARHQALSALGRCARIYSSFDRPKILLSGYRKKQRPKQLLEFIRKNGGVVALCSCLCAIMVGRCVGVLGQEYRVSVVRIMVWAWLRGRPTLFCGWRTILW